jgi:Uri superfamily endonuclease
MGVEPKPGTSALILPCSTKVRVHIGRLGTLWLQPGHYVYLGSALGPGGLRARIAHHQEQSLRPHWHIDYLRAHTQIHCVWFSYDARRREHQWAGAIQALSGAKIPLFGFGASDCNCQSHLYFFKRCPSRSSFRRALGRRHPPVGEF